MVAMECSFCGAPVAPKPEKGAPVLAVAGAKVFICRSCVGTCLELMAGSDPVWRDESIKTLKDLRKRRVWWPRRWKKAGKLSPIRD